MKKNDKNAYTIVIVIIIIWFMIFLTNWTLRLILNETRDNKAIWDYSKTYIWAESAQEIWLLEIKEKWYWYNEWISESDILWDDKNTAKISYTNDWKVKSYSWVLKPLEYNILPLFYIKSDLTEGKIADYSLELLSWDASKFSWNILWKSAWISWNWLNTLKWAKKSLDESNIFSYKEETISNFLSSSEQNYLILFNNSSDDIEYNIESESYFTKPKLNIISSSWLWYFKQNIKTEINYADIVKRSKYSIFSWN